MAKPHLTDYQVMYLVGIKCLVERNYHWYNPLDDTERSLVKLGFVTSRRHADQLAASPPASPLPDFSPVRLVFELTPKGGAFLLSLSPEVIVDTVERCNDVLNVRMEMLPFVQREKMAVTAVIYAIGYLPLERLPEFLASRNDLLRCEAQNRYSILHTEREYEKRRRQTEGSRV